MIRSKHPGEGGFWDCKAFHFLSREECTCVFYLWFFKHYMFSYTSVCMLYFTDLRFYLKRKEVLVWPLGRLWALMHWQNYFI